MLLLLQLLQLLLVEATITPASNAVAVATTADLVATAFAAETATASDAISTPAVIAVTATASTRHQI